MTIMDMLAAGHTTPHYATARISLRNVALITGAHIGILILLVSLRVIPVPLAVSTLTVDILAPTAAQPEPEIAKAQPKPVRPRPTPAKPVAQPIITAPAETAAAAETSAIREPVPTASTAAPAPATITAPRFDADYLTNPAPSYPMVSRRLGEEGKVVLRVYVEPNGQPSQVEIKTSSGSSRLDQAAQEAIRRWQFVPARQGNETVAAWVLVPIVFNLKH